MNAATNSSPTPIAVLTARPMTERRSSGSSRLASMNSTMCAVRTARVGEREQQRLRAERAGHAQRGDEEALPSRRTSPGARPPPRGRRRWSATRSRPTTTTASPSTSRPLSRPSQVGVRSISVVHCVSASTNTRSKNSSSGVTRSPSRITVLTRGARLERAALGVMRPLAGARSALAGDACGRLAP